MFQSTLTAIDTPSPPKGGGNEVRRGARTVIGNKSE